MKEVFHYLMGRIWIIILAILTAAISIGAYTIAFVKPVYSSTATLYILSQSTSITSLADIQLGTQLTKDYVVLVTSRTVVEEVISELGLNTTYGGLVGSISVDNPTDTRILNITVNNTDAKQATEIVNCLADVTSKQVAEIMETDEPNVVDKGIVATQPISPSVKKNTIIGGLLGAFASIGILTVIYLMNDSIRTPEDIERFLGLNTLASIPIEDGKSRKKYHVEHKRAMKKARRKKKLEGKKSSKAIIPTTLDSTSQAAATLESEPEKKEDEINE